MSGCNRWGYDDEDRPMSDIDEAHITINGHKLSAAQSMALRVAATAFWNDMITEGLGDDEIGQAIAQGYADRLREVVHLMIEGKPDDD